jgi:hypothetical protein
MWIANRPERCMRRTMEQMDVEAIYEEGVLKLPHALP